MSDLGGCPCFRCEKRRAKRDNDPLYLATRFIVCETCGNKRCPHGTDHRLDCTRSNEPNQPGSRYQYGKAPS